MKKFIEIPFPLVTFYSVPSNHNLSTISALYTTPKVGKPLRLLVEFADWDGLVATLAKVERVKWNARFFFPKLSKFFVGHNKVIQLMFFFTSFPWTLLSNLLDVLEFGMYVDFFWGRR